MTSMGLALHPTPRKTTVQTQPIIRMLGAAEETATSEDLIRDFEAALGLYGFGAYLLLRHGGEGTATLAGKCFAAPEALNASLPDPVLQQLRTARGGFRIRDALSAAKRTRKPRGEPAGTSAMRWCEGYVFPIHTGRGFAGSLALGGNTVLTTLDLALFDAAARLLFRSFSDAAGDGLPAAFTLTRRESEVLDCLAAGLTSNEIGKVMKISTHTVDWYVNGLQDKFEARNRHHLVALAFRLGMIG